MTVQRVSDINLQEALRVLIFAEPGSGKTALAGSFPAPLFIDTDRGMKTIATSWFKDWSGLSPEEIARIGFQTFDDQYDPKTGLFKSARAFFDAMEFVNEQATQDEFETVVFDSITTMQQLAMHVGLELSVQRGGASKSLARARTPGNHPVAIPTQADYGSEMAAFQQFMDGAQRIAYDLNKHMVMLAHVREDSNDSGVVLEKGPYLIGNAIRGQVAKWFDEVWYLETDRQGKRKLRTQPFRTYKCLKTRHQVPDELEDPTFAKIIKEIR